MSEQIPVQEQEFTVSLLGNDLISIVHGLDLLRRYFWDLPPNEILEPFRERRDGHLIALRNKLDNLVAEAHYKGKDSAEEDDQHGI